MLCHDYVDVELILDVLCKCVEYQKYAVQWISVGCNIIAGHHAVDECIVSQWLKM